MLVGIKANFPTPFGFLCREIKNRGEQEQDYRGHFRRSGRPLGAEVVVGEQRLHESCDLSGNSFSTEIEAFSHRVLKATVDLWRCYGS